MQRGFRARRSLEALYESLPVAMGGCPEVVEDQALPPGRDGRPRQQHARPAPEHRRRGAAAPRAPHRVRRPARVGRHLVGESRPAVRRRRQRKPACHGGALGGRVPGRVGEALRAVGGRARRCAVGVLPRAWPCFPPPPPPPHVVRPVSGPGNSPTAMAAGPTQCLRE